MEDNFPSMNSFISRNSTSSCKPTRTFPATDIYLNGEFHCTFAYMILVSIGGGNPFQNLEKTTVLQEARTFNDTPVNPRKCAHILTKILYLLNQGEQLGTMEATETFFAMTKLFQSRDVVLRRLVYLGIKELSSLAEDVIIVTSSLTKDMTGKEDLYRAAAIRALCTITDGGMLAAIERYMKQAIVDRSPAVSSAALVSSLHLTNVSGDVACGICVWSVSNAAEPFVTV